MSADTHADLEALRRHDAGPLPTRRRWVPKVVGGLIILGLFGAAYAVLEPVFFPPREVRIAAVRPVDDAEGGGRRATSVQAAGWVEADPYPITVRPLVRGIVESLDVLEGTTVEKGKTRIAVLRNAELENALTTAKAQLTLMQAIHQHRKTTLEVTRSILDQKIDLRMAVAQRDGEAATARAAIDGAVAQRKVAEAGLARARVDLEAQLKLQEAGRATPTALATARARVHEAGEQVARMRVAEVEARADLARIEDLRTLAQEALDDPRILEGQVDEARAALVHAAADEQRAQADVEVARRNVDLLTIHAPADGVVLRLESAPGAVVGPAGDFKGSGEGAGSTGLLNRLTGALCSIYDPRKLQVRVDVPYADLPGITQGTEVELEAKAVPGKTFHGVVDRLVREADITQAKLQVKVRVTDPDERLRPEMLCTARFLVKAEVESATSKRGPVRTLVPSEAVRGDAVFVFDPTGGGKARRVGVRVVGTQDGFTVVEGGLGLSSKVILDPVEDGERVKAHAGRSE